MNMTAAMINNSVVVIIMSYNGIGNCMFVILEVCTVIIAFSKHVLLATCAMYAMSL